jgi:8-oxo-dGTP pyrophosphatase MutT (NUDIX family)
MKSIYCLNCGNRNHNKRECLLPVTSYGIILLNIQSEDIYLINKMIDNLKIPNITVSQETLSTANTKRIEITNDLDLKQFCDLKNNIRFLMIKRRHTLGYLEFMRGKYSLDNPEGIQYLFKQMIKSEIEDIGTQEFDELWDNMWGKGKSYKNNEYYESKSKFYSLKTMGKDDDVENNLDFYIKNIVPLWQSQEWGFPKGRRGFYETDLKCAIREFKEETGMSDEDFIILNKIKPVDEIFYGTDGVKYRHVYYLAISTTDKSPTISKNNKNQYYEIGDIRWSNFEDTINLIRPYHTQRIQLTTELFMYIINYINQIK